MTTVPQMLDRLDQLAFAVEHGAFVHGFGSSTKVAREIKEIVRKLRALDRGEKLL